MDDTNHASYCRDALRLLIQKCPDITGVTLRAHSESGIADGSYAFWKTVFAGIATCGRRLDLDIHSKGIDERQIRMALETGQPLRISAKYTAEHMGLPGHQIAIRELERSKPSSTPGDRSFTRYGYADYLAEDRPYGTYFRLWPGKDRVVLWGDPEIVAGYGRHSSFCGAQGLEICEPMSFKGRQGSGLFADRRIYLDPSLEAGWRKYIYGYRLWGRHLYDPETDPDSYRRFLRSDYGPAASPVESALSSASKVIPLVTSAHLPSGAGMTYWPEVYTNMPIADEHERHIYGDTPAPKVFGRVSPLDPGLFMNACEYADELAGGQRSGRYTPAEVAEWLDGFAQKAEARLQEARNLSTNQNDPKFRRMDVDVQTQLGLGRFFAAKLRAAVAWAIFQKDRNKATLGDALYFARAARDAWVSIVKATNGVYLADLSFGEPAFRRGSWADRLPAIEKEVSYLENLAGAAEAGTARKPSAAWLKPRPPHPPCRHTPPPTFSAGQPLAIHLSVSTPGVERALLHYRHVNQAERHAIATMSPTGGTWSAVIPPDYTNSRWALQYHFQLVGKDATNWLFPGLEHHLANLPYFVVRRA